MVRNIRNLLYTDVIYIRAELDKDYINEYLKRQQNARWASEANRLFMIAMGAVMVALAPIPGVGTASAIWGADLIVASTTGKSMFDHAAHQLLRGLGAEESYIESFSFMHFTSDKGIDLILQEMVANGISAITSKIGGRISRAGSQFADFTAKGAEAVVNTKGVTLIGGLRGVLGRTLHEVQERMLKLARPLTTIGKLTAGIGILGRSIIEAMIESVMEFGFDAVQSSNDGDKPLGNNAAFFTCMIAAQILSAYASNKRFDADFAVVDGDVVVTLTRASARSMDYTRLVAKIAQTVMILASANVITSYMVG